MILDRVEMDRAPAAAARPFNLVRWFSILSLVSIVLISAASATFLSSYLKDNMLRRDAVVAMEIINSIVRSQRATSYFADGFGGELHPDLEQFFYHVAHLPDVIAANVFARDGMIIWSSNPALIGKRFDDNEELEDAYAGKLNSEIEILHVGEKREHAYLAGQSGQFIEYYLPIHNDDGENVIGVVEMYRSPGALLAAINTGQRIAWLGSFGAGAFLFAALFWIVRRGNILILKTQAQLVESERLAAIGEMASAVAHGFRNPIASIRSSAELALEEEFPQDTHDYLRDIVAQSDRLEGWIRAFLTDSRDARLDAETVKISETLEESVDGFVTQMQLRRIDVTLGMRRDLLIVRANKSALSQVFNSIIANSIEAMPDGGRLIVECNLAPVDGFIAVSFSDTGVGIPKEHIDVAFKPFATTKGSGLGIGLPIARRIVERFGGALDLSSEVGRGTTVTVRLPAAA